MTNETRKLNHAGDEEMCSTGTPEPVAKQQPLCSRVWAAISPVAADASPVQWRIILLVVLALFGSCYSITFIFPFAPNMVLYFGYAEEEKGYYTGLLASSMFAGRIFGSYFWGWLSDNIGRKPVLLTSLCLTMATNVLFGFSATFAMAVGTRFINGLVNGIIGTGKTILYEVSDNTNQGVGMSSIAMAWGSGIIAGPLISGYLAEPATRYPDVFSESSLFGRFPFLLPSLIAAGMTVIPICTTWFLLPETRRKREVLTIEVDAEEEKDGKTASSEAQQKASDGDVQAEKSLNLSAIPSFLQTKNPHHKAYNASQYSLAHADSADVLDVTSPVYGLGAIATSHGDLLMPDLYNPTQLHMTSTPLQKEFSSSVGDLYQDAAKVRNRSMHSLRGSTRSLKHSKSMEPRDRTITTEPLMLKSSSDTEQAKSSRRLTLCEKFKNTDAYKVLSNRNAMMSISIYFTVSFGVIGYEEVFTVFASTSPALGGLGFTPMQIGNAMGLSSIPLVILTVFLFPICERKFGAKMVFNIFDMYLIFIASTLPSLRVLQYSHNNLFWALLLGAMGLRGICATTCFSANGLHINNSVPPALAGSANGIAMTLTAIGRMLAPTVGGSIYAWSITSGSKIGFPFDLNLVFMVFGVFFLIGNIICALLPEIVNKQTLKGVAKPKP